MAKKKRPKKGTRKAKAGKKTSKKVSKTKKEKKKEPIKTSIQLRSDTRDRLYKLKFRRSYDAFLKELCDMYEEEYGE